MIRCKANNNFIMTFKDIDLLNHKYDPMLRHYKPKDPKDTIDYMQIRNNVHYKCVRCGDVIELTEEEYNKYSQVQAFIPNEVRGDIVQQRKILARNLKQDNNIPEKIKQQLLQDLKYPVDPYIYKPLVEKIEEEDISII